MVSINVAYINAVSINGVSFNMVSVVSVISSLFTHNLSSTYAFDCFCFQQKTENMLLSFCISTSAEPLFSLLVVGCRVWDPRFRCRI